MSEAPNLFDVLKEREKGSGRIEISLAEYVAAFAVRGEEVTVSGKGTSMLPTIDEKCRLVMCPIPGSGAKAGDIVLYSRPNGQSVIHRVWKVNRNSYDMLGDNQIIIERNVPMETAVAYVKTIIYPDGRERQGRKSILLVHIWHYLKRLKAYLRKWVLD